MTEEAIVLETMLTYMQTVLEKPHPAFNGLPLCPFVQRARLQQQIWFHVYRFSDADLATDSALMQTIHAFLAQRTYEVLFVIHPDLSAWSCWNLQRFVESLNHHLATLSLIAFSGHPQHPFQIQGMHTRREPYPNLTIQSLETVKQASSVLSKTRYYENWSPDDLADIQFFQR